MKLLTIFLAFFISTTAFAGHHKEGEMSANLKSVKAAYAAFNTGNIEAWRAELAPDVEWIMQKGMPYEGTWIGAAAVEANVFSVIDEMFTSFQVTPIAYYESGDTVFIHVRMTAEGLDTEVMHMAKMEAGKFAKFQVFENTAQMLAIEK